MAVPYLKCVGGGGGGSHKPTLDIPLDWSPSVGTLIFSSYVGLGPASTVYQKTIGNIRKIFEIFCNPKNGRSLRMYQNTPWDCTIKQ